MAKTALLPVLLAFMLLPFSSTALTQDFCVADFPRGDTPSGYLCKPTVNSDDFFFHGLADATAPVIRPFNISVNDASVKQFPGLNGLDISARLINFNLSGVVPLHAHPRASELIYVVEGNISVGFISSNSNAVYTTTLHKGDVFLFPEAMLHFLYNFGPATASVFAAYSNPNPGTQVLDYALFGNDLPSDVVEKVTFMDDEQVKKLKVLFGGSG